MRASDLEPPMRMLRSPRVRKTLISVGKQLNLELNNSSTYSCTQRKMPQKCVRGVPGVGHEPVVVGSAEHRTRVLENLNQLIRGPGHAIDDGVECARRGISSMRTYHTPSVRQDPVPGLDDRRRRREREGRVVVAQW